MPVSQNAHFEGFEVSAKPAWWLRRWARFPLYFQATQPRFHLAAKKVARGDPGGNKLRFYMEFSDKSRREYTIDVSDYAIDQTITYTTDKNLLAPTGDTRICLDRGLNSFDTLYAFYVNSEAVLFLSLSFLILNVVLGGLIALLIRF